MSVESKLNQPPLGASSVMAGAKPSRLDYLQPLPGLLVLVVAAGLAWLVRVFFVENLSAGAACTIVTSIWDTSWWCILRLGIILAFMFDYVGMLALFLAIVALVCGLLKLKPTRLCSYVTLFVAGLGLAFYQPTLSCIAAFIALGILLQYRTQVAPFSQHVGSAVPSKQ